MIGQVRVGIIGNRLFPLNESYANQAHVLSEIFSAEVFTCSNLGNIPFMKHGRYRIFNSRFIGGKVFLLSVINGFLLYIALKMFERKFNTIILMGGIESEFLKYLNLKKCIPIISTIDDESKVEWFAQKIAPRLKKIIVQSENVKKRLINLGVNPSKINFIYPIVNTKRFKYTEPPPLKNFKILFASAPNVENPYENNFKTKGVPLLLESFKELIAEYNATLFLLWRGKHNKELYDLIGKLGLEENVKIINIVTDVARWHKKTHATVIPYLSSWRSPQYPLSALEALACGRPVITTNVIELAELVRKYNCGCVSRPVKKEFTAALKDCIINYSRYQNNCREVSKLVMNSSITSLLLGEI